MQHDLWAMFSAPLLDDIAECLPPFECAPTVGPAAPPQVFMPHRPNHADLFVDLLQVVEQAVRERGCDCE